MQDSSSYKVSNSFALLLVGEPKTGKSNLAMSFPDPYFLDFDDNLASAVRRISPSKKFFFTSRSSILSQPPEKVWDFIESEVKSAAINPQIKTLVLDSTTTLSGILRDYLLTRLRMGGVKLRTDTVDDQLRIADYGTVATFILRLVALFRSSGKFVIWTNHQRIEKDEITGALRYQLNIPGQLSSTLGGYFTDVWATTSTPQPGNKVKFAIRTKPTGTHISLGASFPIDSEIDITDKSPEQIWTILEPKIIK